MSEDSQIQINLADQIRAAHAEATAIADQAKGYASQAVAKAIECGRLLIRQKESLGHGSWLDWRAEHLPDISHNTVSKYMRLAKAVEALPASDDVGDSNFTHGLNLLDAASARQAYIAAGILPSPENKGNEQPDPNKPWVKFTRFLDGFRLWFNKRIDEDPLATWPEDSRRVLKNELKWFAELYQRL
jgi:hypothetical protein